MKSVVIGSSTGDGVEITVLGYERPATGEYYDDNWLSCEIRVHAGAFRGKFSASLLTSELTDLHKDLDRLYRDLRGEAKFETMESQLELHFKCDNLGHIHIDGTAMDQAGIGNTLSFSLSFDQTFLHQVIQELGQITAAYSVRT